MIWLPPSLRPVAIPTEPPKSKPPTPTRAAAEVRRLARLDAAQTPEEWLSASVDWCPAVGCNLVIRDRNGSRGACGPGCEQRRKLGRHNDFNTTTTAQETA